MCTVKIQFVLWVVMEKVKSHMTQMEVFLTTFFFSHLVDQSKQFDAYENLGSESRRHIGTFVPFYVVLTYAPY